ncbi:MAG TPA: lytic transglycosylase domain-containing protein, partial [Terriglobales bacterium]|nr:lytic transglycosylase domain-containing protein [Terriglobales bacterium]
PSSEITGIDAEQLLEASPPAPPAKPAARSIPELIAGAASTTRIDPDFIASVIRAESGFNPRARSPKGAQGLMQLMPETAGKLGVRNPYDAEANIRGGTEYLRRLLQQYHGDAQKALAAYNAGPLRVQQYGGVPPYRETHRYVARVITDYNRKKLAAKAPAVQSQAAQAAAPAAANPPGR